MAVNTPDLFSNMLQPHCTALNHLHVNVGEKSSWTTPHAAKLVQIEF